ncbi:MAG: YkgJ family cysteine cluster protein [Acidobacteria bacterium]|nr:MAG: YkgJ family cysteine cluster protein [Acidobacteriota bacterium]
MSLDKTLERLTFSFTRADGLWADASARTRPGELACRPGCFGCCLGLFEISAPEALLVRAALERLDAPEREEIVSRSRRIVAETAGSFPGDPVAGILDPDRTEEADDRYFEVVADRACPMLELPTGRCRIYEARPLTCRTYGLAWRRQEELVHPPCTLNLVGAPAERQLATGVDLAVLEREDEALSSATRQHGIDPTLETTLAHVVLGTAFAPLAGS